MPEYHTIQWFVPLEQTSFPTTLVWYRDALARLGVLDQQAENWLANCVWAESDNGMAYFESAPKMTLCVGDICVTTRPLIGGWTPTIYSTLTHPWVEYELLFESDDVRDVFQPSGYKPGMLDALWTVMEQCYAAFPPTALYLTDEAQDGEPFSGRVEHKPEAFWTFDQALVPSHLDMFQSERPARLHVTQFDAYRRYSVQP